MSVSLSRVQPTLSIMRLLCRYYLPLKPSLRGPTIVEYQSNVRCFSKFIRWKLANSGARLRDAQIRDLTDENLAGLLRWYLDKELGAPTANKVFRTVRLLWRFLYKNHVLEQLPRVEPLDEDVDGRKTWLPSNYQSILDCCSALRGDIDLVSIGYPVNCPESIFWLALLSVIGLVGGRIGATMKIRWQDLDFERSDLTIRARTQKQRKFQTFELSRTVVTAVRRLEPFTRRNDDDLVFAWPHDPSTGQLKKDWSTLRRHYRRILKSAGLRNTSKDLFHGLRAMVATWITAEEGIEKARQYLGHSHVSVTQKYLDQSQLKEKNSAVNVLPQFTVQSQLRLFDAS